MSDNTGSRLIGGVLIGALVGAGLALLLAPASGRETRRRLADKARTLRENAQDGFDAVQRAVKEEAGGVAAAFREGRETYLHSVQGSDIDVQESGAE